MKTLLHFIAPPSQCGYLPDRQWSLEYRQVAAVSEAEYGERLLENWRRFGDMLFRPRCASCAECRSLRVIVAEFTPTRSQQRARRRNQGEVTLRIGRPTVSRAKLDLYDRFHEFQSEHKGWPDHPPKDAGNYLESFVHNPSFTEEWCYFLEDRLMGVGYVDRLSIGLSAIYFFYDPEVRDRSLGTWNVLCLLEEARTSGLPYVFLGYYVKGSPSLEYKGNFRPYEVREPDGEWRRFKA